MGGGGSRGGRDLQRCLGTVHRRGHIHYRKAERWKLALSGARFLGSVTSQRPTPRGDGAEADVDQSLPCAWATQSG